MKSFTNKKPFIHILATTAVVSLQAIQPTQYIDLGNLREGKP